MPEHSAEFVALQQQELTLRLAQVIADLRHINGALMHGAEWDWGHASEWRDAKRIMGRIDERIARRGENDE